MADINNWKPFYQKRGKYKDGREKICISWYEKGMIKKTLMLPKPEELRIILSEHKDVLLNGTSERIKFKKSPHVPQKCELSVP